MHMEELFGLFAMVEFFMSSGLSSCEGSRATLEIEPWDVRGERPWSVVLRPVASASPGNVLEMQIIRHLGHPTE